MDAACLDQNRRSGDGAVMVRVLTADEADGAVPGLTDVLLDCVEGGASVSFMAPLDRATAESFWRSVAAGVERGERILLVAEDGDGVLGTVQLVVAQPPNQPHRADLSKMLVHRRGRRRGVGAALMQAAEDAGRAAGKTLLVLDTASPEAERLYTRAGWVKVGVIPNFALWPQGGLCDTAFFYKALG
ncbi:GNAT family N-acetyltransferase [Azospirillum melinis]|uniref:GNAT family N-acetyltransferase n=1 Tax=Azospirillum melinis TaxID=328839 RepID=A0ABX2KIN2_9PROT|nr:GNAT family N-acetyltransferase [Azospirillum melinis]MBP2306167.1 GNAT superfamily N-acetyltransferase [Azospirillum melinis]NUB03440.1 GNAT family N-acetyltransferase [Azospirillum melinis]